MAKLTPEQRRVVAQLKAAPSYKRASPKVRKALLEAAAVESNFSTPNQANSDRDSEGALQQRPSTGWGPTSESNTTDAEQFLRRAIPIAGKYGSAGALAQAVQRSAFPDRYNQRSSLAESLLRGEGGTAGTTGGTGSSGTTRTTTTTTPGVDNRFARANLITSFLEDKDSDPVEFAAQARQLKDIPATTTSKTVRTPGGGTQELAGGGDSSFGTSFAKTHSGLKELFYDPQGGWKNGQSIGPIGGHSDHVHVAAGRKTTIALGRLAQQMGLHVGENPKFGGVAPVHTPTSYHYKGEAIDVSGSPAKMAAYARRVRRLYGIK